MIYREAVILKCFNQHYKHTKSWAQPSCKVGVIVVRQLPARLFSKGTLELIVLTQINTFKHGTFCINRL